MSSSDIHNCKIINVHCFEPCHLPYLSQKQQETNTIIIIISRTAAFPTTHIYFYVCFYKFTFIITYTQVKKKHIHKEKKHLNYKTEWKVISLVLGTHLIPNEFTHCSWLFPQQAKSCKTVIILLIVALILWWDHFPIIHLISSVRRGFFHLGGESRLQKSALHAEEVTVSRRETPLAGHICFAGVGKFYIWLLGAKMYVPSVNKQTGEN